MSKNVVIPVVAAIVAVVVSVITLTGCDTDLTALAREKLLPLGEAKADAEITQLVTDGKLTPDQADKIRAIYAKLKAAAEKTDTAEAAEAVSEPTATTAPAAATDTATVEPKGE
ncbi:MAG: hypothetical protein PHQ27_02440 [Victivallales bacterium]|nr:hypothetical protein [Victivallales bacterium]